MLKLAVEEAQAISLNRHIPFYSYRLPGERQTHFGAQIKGEVLHFENLQSAGEGFIAVPFAETPATPALFIRQDVAFTGMTEKSDIIEALQTFSSDGKQRGIPENSVSPEEYHVQVTAMIDALRGGVARKAVLARGLTIQIPGIGKAPEWFKSLETRYPEAFVFLVSVPGVMTWMGASPEIFLKREKSGIETMALAGTRQAGDTTQWGDKEMEEQAIVSEYISALLPDAGKWKVQGPFSKRAGNVEHLCTTFVSPGSIKEEEVERLRLALHPTPAVGGFPRENAITLIRQIEGEKRRYYAGYLGPLQKDKTFRWYVNLRSMELFPEAVRLYIGGGITALSDPLQEWKETELKSGTLLDVMKKGFC